MELIAPLGDCPAAIYRQPRSFEPVRQTPVCRNQHSFIAIDHHNARMSIVVFNGLYVTGEAKSGRIGRRFSGCVEDEALHTRDREHTPVGATEAFYHRRPRDLSRGLYVLQKPYKGRYYVS